MVSRVMVPLVVDSFMAWASPATLKVVILLVSKSPLERSKYTPPVEAVRTKVPVPWLTSMLLASAPMEAAVKVMVPFELEVSISVADEPLVIPPVAVKVA